MEDNQFLANLQEEGEGNAFTPEKETLEKVTPAAPPAGDKPSSEPASPAAGGDGNPPKEGEDLAVFNAFHKHPRWIEAQEELRGLREFKEKVEPLLPKLEQFQKPTEPQGDIPAWFETLFGRNLEAYELYRKHTAEERKQIREELVKEFEDKEQAKLKETKKYDDWLEGEVKKLKEKDPSLDEAAVLDIIIKYRPTDDEGRISLTGAYDLWKATAKAPDGSKPNQTVVEKKKIADGTIRKSGGSGAKKEFLNSHDLQGKSFADLVALEI